MAVLNRDGLIKKVATETSLSFADVAKALSSTEETIMETVAEGDSVKLMGFISLEPTLRAPRVYKNPNTGEEIAVGETSGIRIRPMKNFRDRVAATRQ